MRKASDIEKQLRQAILESHMSQAELWRASGVAEAVISRFTRGDRTITIATAAKLSQALNMALVHRDQTKQKGT